MSETRRIPSRLERAVAAATLAIIIGAALNAHVSNPVFGIVVFLGVFAASELIVRWRARAEGDDSYLKASWDDTPVWALFLASLVGLVLGLLRG